MSNIYWTDDKRASLKAAILRGDDNSILATVFKDEKTRKPRGTAGLNAKRFALYYNIIDSVPNITDQEKQKVALATRVQEMGTANDMVSGKFKELATHRPIAPGDRLMTYINETPLTDVEEKDGVIVRKSGKAKPKAQKKTDSVAAPDKTLENDLDMLEEIEVSDPIDADVVPPPKKNEAKVSKSEPDSIKVTPLTYEVAIKHPRHMAVSDDQVLKQLEVLNAGMRDLNTGIKEVSSGIKEVAKLLQMLLDK